jgi:hypothetical protein
MTAFLLMNLIAGSSAFCLNYRALRFNNFVDSLISLFLIYLSQVIATQLFLGICSALYLRNLILLNLVVFLFVWWLTRNRVSSFNIASLKPQLNSLLGNKIILFGFCLILGFAVVKIFINLVNPPFGWDSLNYHFTFPVEWLKHANLNNPITVSDDPAPTYYPINGSLWFLWLIFPFRSIFLADLGQVAFFVLAALALYNIARKLGLSRELSVYAVLLFTVIPNFFKQLQIAYVDVMVGALFFCCLNFLFSLKSEFTLRNALLYGLSLGLFIGTKTIALAYGALLVLPFLWLCAANIRKSYLGVYALSAAFILGGFAYLRNFIQTGNPLYPVDFQLFGKIIFRGVIDKSSYGAHFKPQDYSLSKILFHEGLGAQSLIFILPSVFLALPLALLRKKKVSFFLLYFLVLPFSCYLVFRYVIPLANTRYLYPCLGIGLITGMYFYDLLGIPAALMRVLVLLCLLASLPELAKRQELVAAAILTFTLLVLSGPLLKICARIARAGWRAALILSLAGIFCLSPLERFYLKNEYPGYAKMVKYSGFWPQATQAWAWLNENTNGNNIAYVGRPVPFPLYGTSFKNNVYYVSVNKTEPAKLHYFKQSRYRWGDDFSQFHCDLEEPGNYRGAASYAVWLSNLSSRDTDYLFIYSLHQTKDIQFPMEDAWAKVHPDRFRSVFSNETIHIYRVLK